MFARYKININAFSGVTATTISLPISMEFQQVDQSELVRTDFVTKEVELAINPPVDNERVRFSPLYSGLTGTEIPLDYVTYGLVFSATTPTSTSTFAEISVTSSGETFVNDDLKYRRNILTNTFLRLMYYDNDIPSDQNLIATQELFVNIKNPNLVLLTLPVEFRFSSPIKNPTGFAEGYYIYHYKDDVDPDPAPPKVLYMKADFNNAKNGKTTKLVTKAGPISMGDLLDYIHTKYLLKRDLNGYYYVIDPTNINVSFNLTNKEAIVKLYESIVI